MGWIGVDLDGTLAEWGTPDPVTSDVRRIGDPIPAMVETVRAFLAEGKEVRIFTARVGPATTDECCNALDGLTAGEAAAVQMHAFDPAVHDPQAYWMHYQMGLIEGWCLQHLGQILPITAVKDFHMVALYDDRCVQVITNTGEILEERCLRLQREIDHFQDVQQHPEGG